MDFRCILLCACLATVQLPAHAADTRVPLSAFVLEDQFYNPRLSPDGKYIAVTVRVPSGDRYVPTVTVYSLPDLKIVGAIRLPAFELPLGYVWVSRTRLAIAKGKELGSREKPIATGEVLAINFDGSKQEYLYGYHMFKGSTRGDRYGDDYGYGSITAVARELNGHFYLASHLWEGNHSMLYDIDSQSAIRKLLADLPLPYLSFLLQHDGKPRFGYGWGEDANAVLFRRNDTSGSWDLLSGDKLGRSFWPQAFSADNSEFIASYSEKGGPDVLVRENLGSGARTTLLQDPNGSIDNFIYGAKRGLPFAAGTSVGIQRAQYLDENSDEAKLHRALSGQFPGYYVNFINFTDDGKQLLFSVRSDRDPGSYYLYDKVSNKADLLFSTKEAIDPDQMTERRAIGFTARDGMQLFGYLTMPKHADKAKLGLVLMPHGGPHGVYDDWFFDTDAQFLASRGYAVLQVNFRGSPGRGINFEHAGYRQWGGKIQDDLIDGVKWAVAQGEVDATRVCTYGASFGGYAALMLAAREPDMFKCAVGYAGVYDLKLLYKEDATRMYKQTLNFYKKVLGEDNDELNRFSPVTLAGKIKVPVLLVHGEKDKIAPFEHAELMRAALIKEGRPPEWMVAPTEGHGFYDTRNVTAFYEKLEVFLARHIGR